MKNGIEHEFLRQHDAERAARGLEVGHNVVALDEDMPFVGARESREDADQCGFAGTVGSQQAEEFARFDAQVHAFERLQLFIALLDVYVFRWLT